MKKFIIFLALCGTLSAQRIQNSINNPLSSLGSLNLSGGVPKNIFVSHITSGNVDLYTPAAGKRALVSNFTVYNDSAGTPTGYPEVKVSATYYPLASVAATIAANTTSNIVFGLILDSTTTLAFNAGTTAVINVWASIIEYDATVPVFSKYVAGLASGNNTIYTVTSGRTGCLLSTTSSNKDAAFGLNTGAKSVGYFNGSGGSRTITVNLVPSGGSVATTNLFGFSISTGNNALYAGAVGSACLSAGDFVNIATDANTATQFAWVNVIEQ